MEIICLSGFARAGKDEVAKILVRDFDFKQIAFADKLRDVLYALNPIISQSLHGPLAGEPVENTVYLQGVIHAYGWNGYKETVYGPEIRRLLQRLGTEAGRQTLWDSIWIDAALTGYDEDARLVVSDGRFINEFDAVTARGGKVWRVNRPGVNAQSNHLSETEALQYTNFDKIISNDSTLDALKDKVIRAYTL